MADPAPPATSEKPPSPRPHFLVNVLWSWVGVGVSVLIGLVLSPIIIRTLGEERYGVWAVVFSLIDYLWFFDLGFNTAVTNFSARFHARREHDKVNEVLSTALVYFGGVALVLASLAVVISQNAAALFPKVSAAHQRELSLLILITGVSWAFFTMLHIFTSALDGFQRFDITSRAWGVALLVRSGGCVTLLWMGYGLVEMGLVTVAGQLIGYLLNFFAFRRVFAPLNLSVSLASRSMIREMARYGVDSFFANAATILLNQGPPLLIGRYRGMAEAGFYTLPSRLLQYAVDAVSRVGLVTRSSAAERDATGRKDSVLQLGIYSNRYCLTLFVPLGLFLLVYGRELIRVWITPAYADSSAPLLAILAPATGLVMAGQFNSSAILFGLGAHRRYAHALMVEALVTLAGLYWVLPRHGILGAAWVAGVLMLFVRGLYTPWLVCRSLNTSFAQYMAGIYLRPLAVALPVAAILRTVKTQWLPGANWGELILAGAATVALFWTLAWFFAIERRHRELIVAGAGARLRRFGKAADA